MSFNEAREKVRQIWDAYQREQNPERKEELHAEFKKARDEMYAVVITKINRCRAAKFINDCT